MKRSLRGVAARATEQVDGHLTQCGDPQAANHVDEVEDNVYFPGVSATLASLWAGRNPSASALPAMSRT
jgi:maleate cis-trans isomerase